MTKIYGIDLGTTRSSIACVDETGNSIVIPNFEGSMLTPSVVHFHGGDSYTVGEQAANNAKLYPDQVCALIKRDMGSDISRTFEGQDYRPEAISALILKKVVGDAEDYEGQTIKDVVITCPAYFNISEKEATRQAGELAGLNVHMIIHEPVAAAVAYGAKTGGDGVILIYDLGGGTFDITAMQIKGNEYTAIITEGDRYLGGQTWDATIVPYLIEKWQEEHGFDDDPGDDPRSLQSIYDEAETAKIKLSRQPEVQVAVSHQGRTTMVPLSRDTFDELTAHLVQQTIELTRQVVEEVKARGYNIDDLLLVGGSSKMPQIKQRIDQEFGLDAKIHEPDYAVAKGAAIYANSISASPVPSRGLAAGERLEIRQVTSHSFGMVAHSPGPAGDTEVRERVVNIIQKGTQLPAQMKDDSFGPLHDNQASVAIQIVENSNKGGHAEVLESTQLATGDLELPPGTPAGEPIEVTFDLDESGLLNVTARLLRDGRQVNIQYQITSSMTEEEVSASTKKLDGLTRI